MFRLVFLAFHGERRFEPIDRPAGRRAHAPAHPEEEEPAAKAAGHGHGPASHGGHGLHLHDAPPSMAIPLVVLAIGAVLAGYVGIPTILGGSNRIERFLEPSFTVAAPEAVESGSSPTPHESEGHAAGHDASTEWALMGTATAAAFVGIGLAAIFWWKRRDLAATAAARFRGPYRLLLKKYYVDEVYDTSIVQPVKLISEQVLWKGVDQGVIDGAVNGAAVSVGNVSGVLRQLQTGSIRASAASLFVGVLLVLAYALWP
jgi:NADH-quinone oxidoreductase subunit L